MTKKKLVLGPGENNYGPEWVHLDIVNIDHIDVVHDLDTGKLPFESDTFTEVKAVNVLEHVVEEAYNSLIEEIHRVCKGGATVTVVGPYYLSGNSVAGDHNRAYSKVSFDCFSVDHEYPGPEPELFRIQDVRYREWNLGFPLNVSAALWGREWAACHIPNAVNEVEFTLEVVK